MHARQRAGAISTIQAARARLRRAMSAKSLPVSRGATGWPEFHPEPPVRLARDHNEIGFGGDAVMGEGNADRLTGHQIRADFQAQTLSGNIQHARRVMRTANGDRAILFDVRARLHAPVRIMRGRADRLHDAAAEFLDPFGDGGRTAANPIRLRAAGGGIAGHMRDAVCHRLHRGTVFGHVARNLLRRCRLLFDRRRNADRDLGYFRNGRADIMEDRDGAARRLLDFSDLPGNLLGGPRPSGRPDS